MREILFRAKKKKNGEWMEGFPVRIYDYGGLVWEMHPFNTNFECSHSVIPETIGQYTGLTDKNYKKIFEGDIVDILTENEEIGIVTYDEGGFWVHADGFSVDFHVNINGTDLEVIGNIHDNPELLEE